MITILYIIKILYTTFLLPPGIFIVLLLLLAFRLYKRCKKSAALSFALAMLLYLTSIPLLSDALIRSLEARYTPPSTISGDVFILLGGGATMDTPNLNGQGHLGSHAANRLLTTVQLYHHYQLPIIASGGKVLETTGTEAEISRVILLDLSVPENKILIENQSLNTTQNAAYTKKLMDQHNLTQPILITSAFHMPRAVKQFSKVGVPVTAYPAGYQVNIYEKITWMHLVPSSSALDNFSIALREYIGLAVINWY